LIASRADVREDRVDLGGDDLCRDLMDGLHAEGVLGGDRRDGRGAIDTERGKRLEVGLDPGPTTRIGAGDRERARLRPASLCDRTIGGRHGMSSLLTTEMPSSGERGRHRVRCGLLPSLV